ncbi:MAG: YitT family protein, partial [Oscillospiraceae bacterium]|nr:YitT family protein [Oscillospiraceae bacterium]
MEKLFGENWLKRMLIEMAGALMTSVAVYNFAIPAGFPMAGFSGIAIIIHRLLSLPVGITTLVLNIPVALLCWKLIGRKFFARSIRCMVFCTVFTDYVVPLLPLYTGSRMIAAVCTGVIGGFGYALIYMCLSSSGGTDFIVMALKSKHQHIRLGMLVFIVDALIIFAGGLIFRDFDGMVYGMIIDYVYAIMTDKIIYGMNSGKLALIVTDFSREVTKRIDEVCGRGTTIISARGGYKEDKRDIVLCACSTKDMISVESAVRDIDANAFSVVL